MLMLGLLIMRLNLNIATGTCCCDPVSIRGGGGLALQLDYFVYFIKHPTKKYLPHGAKPGPPGWVPVFLKESLVFGPSLFPWPWGPGKEPR